MLGYRNLRKDHKRRFDAEAVPTWEALNLVSQTLTAARSPLCTLKSQSHCLLLALWCYAFELPEDFVSLRRYV